MIRERNEVQNQMEVVMLEQLVLKDDLLRKINKYRSCSFLSFFLCNILYYILQHILSKVFNFSVLNAFLLSHS